MWIADVQRGMRFASCPDRPEYRKEFEALGDPHPCGSQSGCTSRGCSGSTPEREVCILVSPGNGEAVHWHFLTNEQLEPL